MLEYFGANDNVHAFARHFKRRAKKRASRQTPRARSFDREGVAVESHEGRTRKSCYQSRQDLSRSATEIEDSKNVVPSLDRVKVNEMLAGDEVIG